MYFSKFLCKVMFNKKDHLSFLFLKVNSVINKNQPLVLYILVIFYDFLLCSCVTDIKNAIHLAHCETKSREVREMTWRYRALCCQHILLHQLQGKGLACFNLMSI